MHLQGDSEECLHFMFFSDCQYWASKLKDIYVHLQFYIELCIYNATKMSVTHLLLVTYLYICL